MSTTFGIVIRDEEIEIARRVNQRMYFTHPLAELLPNQQPVVALDNTPQGVYTIGDIKDDEMFFDING